MKYYCKQVDPTCQVIPIFGKYNFPDNIVVYGNRAYEEHLNNLFKNIRNVIKDGELAEVLENIEDSVYENAMQAINEFLDCKCSEEECREIMEIIEDFYCSRIEIFDTLCKIMSIIDKNKWKYKLIKGCTQSEWNYIFYPVSEWKESDLKAFEIEYFNMGTEWIINDDVENLGKIYVHSCSEKEVAKEIAERLGVDISDIVLYAFDGYTKTPKYKEVIL